MSKPADRSLGDRDVTHDPVALALWNNLRSPNESDSNGEVANVVDGLFAIARSNFAIAESIDRLADFISTKGVGE